MTDSKESGGEFSWCSSTWKKSIQQDPPWLDAATQAYATRRAVGMAKRSDDNKCLCEETRSVGGDRL